MMSHVLWDFEGFCQKQKEVDPTTLERDVENIGTMTSASRAFRSSSKAAPKYWDSRSRPPQVRLKDQL